MPTALQQEWQNLTPTQLECRRAHRERLARMAAAAYRQPESNPVDNPVLEAKIPQIIPEIAAFAEIGAEPPECAAARRITVRDIVRTCARAYGVAPIDILSHRRTADVVRPRQVAMYLARHMTLLTLPQIGRAFGGRDHTTAIHACRKIERLLRDDADMPSVIAQLKARLGVGDPEAV